MKNYLMAAACLWLVACNKETVKPVEAKAAAPVVNTVTAQQRKRAVAITASGSFVAPQSAGVASEGEGLIAEIVADTGRLVRQGDVLLRLRPEAAKLRVDQAEASERQAAAALAQAKARTGADNQAASSPEALAARASWEALQADLRLAQREETRAGNLLKTGDVSRAAFDRAAASRAAAEARALAAKQQYESSLNSARQDLAGVLAAEAALASARAQTQLTRKAANDLVVRAPFDGAISARHVSVGEYITTATRLFTLDKLQPLRLVLNLPETQAAHVKTGQLVTATLESWPGETFAGRITAVQPSINAASRSFQAEATFENKDRRLRPGMFAAGRIEQGREEDLLVVPLSAVQEDSRTDAWRLWVKEQQTARLRIVQLRGRTETEAWVVGGLKPGEAVITGNVSKLFDGMEVK
jgi:multidrug efflux pump subunit AcrA (membrane-fusion protein)